MKPLILCADDFSQSAAITRGILRLVEMNRLNAVSCFTQSPTWTRDARELRERSPAALQVGLHFNLTFPSAQPGRPVIAVLAAALSGTINRERLRKALDEQWESFVGAMGRPPDFVDGHQHVHVFPIIRELVIEKVRREGTDCWIRNLRLSPEGGEGLPKTLLLTWLNRPFRLLLGKAAVRSNRYFLGFRPYHASFHFENAFRQWLRVAARGTLIMCHPAADARDGTDPIRQCRFEEFRYLVSRRFEADLRDFRISLEASRASSISHDRAVRD